MTSKIVQAPRRLLRAVQSFLHTEAAGGILLLIFALIALAWANSPWAESYDALWSTYFTVGAGAFAIDKPIVLWINDGLMALFFFVVGLEIKREVLVGELATVRKAALPAAAAVGGMVVPALVYVAFNAGGPGAAGWAIPMATDIAFAVGVLALVGSRAPLALKVFLLAVAIVDDLGAVLVIAFFYTAEVSAASLAVAAVFLIALVVANRAGVRRPLPYVVFGLIVWVAVLKSGVHATIAGVLVAFTVPARRTIDAEALRTRILDLADRLSAPGESDRQDVIHALEETAEGAETPLARMEHALHPWVAFFIVPLFALANAGVALGGGADLTGPITVGVALGLVLGKPVGVLLAAWLVVRSGVTALPGGVTWRQIAGAACLCGIGFTMSLFIASLGFGAGAELDAAKVGILAASLVAGALGALLLRGGPNYAPSASPVSEGAASVRAG